MQHDVSEEFLQALAYSRSLTHMYMLDARFFSPYMQFEDFPQLCELCTYVREIPPKQKQLAGVASGFSPTQLNLEDHGVCGFVKQRRARGRTVVTVDSDLQSLWPATGSMDSLSLHSFN